MLLLLLAGLAAASLAREPSFEEFRAIHDSLVMQHPRLRARWLDERGLEMPGWNVPLPTTDLPDSGGLRLVGKWGRGPAYEVTARDSLVFLSLGSEVAIINMADQENPEVLHELQARSIVVQARLQGNVLFVGDRAELSIWDVTELTDPVRLSVIPYGVGDFAVSDTLLALTRQGTFRVFSVADPANPRQLGTLPDNGTVHAVTGSLFLLIGYNCSGIYIIDCSDPAHPARLGSIGIDALAVEARGNLLLATKWWNGDEYDDDFWLDFYDISNPQAPRFLSEIHGIGGYDIHLSGPLAFVSGFYHTFIPTIVDISDSTRPRLISQCGTPGDRRGIWADWTSDWAYVADRFAGLTVLDISNINAPVVDTSIVGSGCADDVDVQDSLMFVAASSGDLQIVDISDPSKPTLVFKGRGFGQYSVAVADSFAYVDAFAIENLRVLDITDPRNPVAVGGVDLVNPLEDLILRDSFLYCVEDYYFQVVDVANPREPRLVGTCRLPFSCHYMDLQDSVVYVADITSMPTISVADPYNPRIIGGWSKYASGVFVKDTFAFTVGADYAVWALSVSDPAAPRILDSVYVGNDGQGVVAVGSMVYSSVNEIFVIDATDPSDLRLVDTVSTPGWVYRLFYIPPYVYAACYEAGVCIFEPTPAAIANVPLSIQKRPGTTLVRGMLQLPGRAGAEMLDICGRRVMELQPGPNDISRLSPGVYFIHPKAEGGRLKAKQDIAVRKLVITQ